MGRAPRPTAPPDNSDDAGATLVTLGRIVGLYGVAGWVRVYSWTRPPANILGYSHWRCRRGNAWQALRLESGRPQGKGLVAKLETVDDRESAKSYLSSDIAVGRDELPPPAPGEFYWSDLEGLRVETTEGLALGKVDHLLETGANDVLVVRGERERLIPFILERFVVDVDLSDGVIRVDWDPDF